MSELRKWIAQHDEKETKYLVVVGGQVFGTTWNLTPTMLRLSLWACERRDQQIFWLTLQSVPIFKRLILSKRFLKRIRRPTKYKAIVDVWSPKLLLSTKFGSRGLDLPMAASDAQSWYNEGMDNVRSGEKSLNETTDDLEEELYDGTNDPEAQEKDFNERMDKLLAISRRVLAELAEERRKKLMPCSSIQRGLSCV